MSVFTHLTDEKLNRVDHPVADGIERSINGKGLTFLPALIDPHVHFRTPGQEYKENWVSGSSAAIAGGVTEVFDMPNNQPPIISAASLREKKDYIENQLRESTIPLRYQLFFGATPDNLDEIRKVSNEVVGIKLFMGSSTGSLLVNQRVHQEQIFKLARNLKLTIAVHAEDESIMIFSYFFVPKSCLITAVDTMPPASPATK